MNNDLISRKALLEELKTLERLVRDRVTDTPWDSPCRQRYQAQLFERERLKELVEKMPIAFDKEKIIEELKSWEKASHDAGIQSAYAELDNKASGYYQESRAYHRAIEIVEKGGIE